MKLSSCKFKNIQNIGIVYEDQLVLSSMVKKWPSGVASMLDLIDAGPDVLRELEIIRADAVKDNNLVPIASVELLAPVPVPRKNIMCLGFNYAEHAKESLAVHKREIKYPDDPIIFTKSVSSINAPYADIPFNEKISNELDWEVELAVVIGKGGKAILASDALSHVFGYSIINDISARDLQFRHKQYFLGKSLDGACPMGPWIVTPDEISNPQALQLSCRVNGELKQQSTTANMIFKVANIIEILSKGMTLQPGDIIATGTPSGVGFARTPPEFLQPGDVVECEIENIGVIRNTVCRI